MPELTEKQRKNFVTILLLFVVAIAGLLYYWFMFGSSSIDTAQAKVAEYEAEKKKISKDLAVINQFEAMTEGQMEEIEQKIAKASLRLPQTRQPAGFYTALRDILQVTGIDTRRLVREDIADYGRFAEIPYSIEALGRFHEFGYMLNLVEENERFMRLKELKLMNDTDRPSLHPIEMSIATFMLKQPGQKEN